MHASGKEIDLPETWRRGIGAAIERRRVVVLGPTDSGKSSFIRSVLQASEATHLIDLDPGQKMIGPPGTVAVGTAEWPERFIFIGTTSASAISAIHEAASALAAGAEPFIVNSSGFVKGPGARLQALTVGAVQPDLIVEIGEEPILQTPKVEVLRLERSAFARRKPPGLRAALRQAAFDREMAGAARWALSGVETAPAPPAAWTSAARPVCALANERGVDMRLGILEAADEEALHILARMPPEPVRLVRLGKMWAEPKEGGWRLLERLSPSWREP